MPYVIEDMPNQVSQTLVEKCALVETATIGHIRHMGFVDKEIQNVSGEQAQMAGTAVTLAIPGQDSTLLHHVIQFLRPGDILCIDRLGDHKHACLGGGVAAAIVATGCKAVVIDGPCTDLPEIKQHGLFVWSRGVAPVTTRVYDIGGSFNVPIVIGGSVVNPGDLVVADVSGVLVMPSDDAEADVDWALKKRKGEPGTQNRLLKGERLGDISGASAKVTASLAQND